MARPSASRSSDDRGATPPRSGSTPPDAHAAAERHGTATPALAHAASTRDLVVRSPGYTTDRAPAPASPHALPHEGRGSPCRPRGRRATPVVAHGGLAHDRSDPPARPRQRQLAQALSSERHRRRSHAPIAAQPRRARTALAAARRPEPRRRPSPTSACSRARGAGHAVKASRPVERLVELRRAARRTMKPPSRAGPRSFALLRLERHLRRPRRAAGDTTVA